jgi:hypothetical protein
MTKKEMITCNKFFKKDFPIEFWEDNYVEEDFPEQVVDELEQVKLKFTWLRSEHACRHTKN